MSVKDFTYTKKDGSVSERHVFVLKEPSDLMLAIDLTEYSPEERSDFEDLLEQLNQQFKDSIKEVGLASNYRNFNKNQINFS